MSGPTLVILAAGIGSRYGGLKQAEPIGPNGELIIHYSVYDALRAGFTKVVFLIRRDIEAIFRDRVGRAVERRLDVAYTFQELDDVPPGFAVPRGRTKPWGTGHALLCCRGAVSGNFAAINADDFYGASSFRYLAAYLKTAHDRSGKHHYAMVGYVLNNTLPEQGYVARGVCTVGARGYLASVREHKQVERLPDGIWSRDADGAPQPLAPDTVVSMNMWGFTPSFFSELTTRFPAFLDRAAATNPLKSEFLLPDIMGDLVSEGRTHVKVLRSDDKWFGVTYQADLDGVKAGIRKLIATGQYPAELW